MFNSETMKLGRKAIKRDSRTMRLSRYFTAELPAPPASCDYSKGITQFGMMLNDQLGCCTIAGIGHALQTWTANVSTEITVPDSSILTFYEKWDGYVQCDPSTDQGGIELDVLKNWKNSDFSGYKLNAYGSIHPAATDHVKQAINLFGGVYIGISLPLSAQNQIGSTWDVAGGKSGAAGSWGGHAVFVLAYDDKGLTCVTWGELQKMTWDFWNTYVDECYGLVSPDWIGANGNSPCGFNLAQLESDVAQIT